MISQPTSRELSLHRPLGYNRYNVMQQLQERLPIDLKLRYLTSTREVLMGEGNGVASVTMLTFTKRPGPHADFYKEARPPC